MSSSLEAQLQAGTREYQQTQTDYANAVEQRQRLDAQKTENEAVKKEFAVLTPQNQIFKLVGGVLLKQEQSEAKANVDKRLEYIQGEINRVETTLKDLDAKMDAKRQQLVDLQSKLQAQQSNEGIPAAAAA
ncbi:Prefoldin subunit 6 [Microbotryomycetes sp. JL221]|nr:Prefoldin subunit 6 [Microbotryomycetes sp. JL221]